MKRVAIGQCSWAYERIWPCQHARKSIWRKSFTNILSWTFPSKAKVIGIAYFDEIFILWHKTIGATFTCKRKPYPSGNDYKSSQREACLLTIGSAFTRSPHVTIIWLKGSKHIVLYSIRDHVSMKLYSIYIAEKGFIHLALTKHSPTWIPGLHFGGVSGEDLYFRRYLVAQF